MPANPTQTTYLAGLRTYHGSCHCGAVRYEIDLDLAAGTTRCNCTYCTKTGWWSASCKPSAFRLLSGGDQLVGTGRNPMVFPTTCRTCGLIAFGHGDIPEVGGEYYQANVRCLDDAVLEGVSVHHLDGLHDTWAPLGTSIYVSPVAGGRAV